MNVVITGASKGIGLAIAEKLLADDANTKLAICSRTRTEIEQTRARLLEQYPHAMIFAHGCDVSNEAEVRAFADSVQNELGDVDVLVNNAGFGRFAPVHKLSTQDWKDVLNTNLRGVFLMTQALLPAMRAKKHGTIITISSIAGKQAIATGAAYSAAKFGVRGLMQSLFLEVREDNIRVVTIFPGSVDTDFFRAAGVTSLMSPKALQSDDIADAVLAAINLPQHADVSEMDIRPTNPKG